ncbi:MAG TPA: DUF3108 domain-containing protein [Pyrinomonadaceae bacterium]|nr:DUF3108 domain-containing protein [Pyrinomonadaceae bacterium]
MPRRSLRHYLAATLLSAVVLSSIAPASGTPKEHTPRGDAPPLPFVPSEQLVYEGEFSKLLLRGIKIAELRFTANRPAQAAAPAGTAGTVAPLLLTTDVESKGWFRKLFGLNFRYHVETTVGGDSFNVLRTAKLDEQGKRVRTSEAVFDYEGKRVEWTERDPNNQAQAPRVVTAALEGPTQDIVSAIYFLRTLPLTPGQTFDISISDSGRVYRVPGRVVAEKKKMKSVLGKVSVVRVDVELFGEGRPIEGKGKMSMWVTSDERRIPVKARLSHDLGQLDIHLKSIRRDPAQTAAAK